MSMDEEYLDNLLNSMTNNSGQGADDDESLQEKTIIADIDSDNSQDSEETSDNADESWKTSLDELLAAADTMAEGNARQEAGGDEDFDKLISAVGDTPMEFENSADGASSDMDVTQMIDSMGGEDDDLAAIRDLLIKSDNNEMITGELSADDSGMEGEITVDGIDGGRKKKKIKSPFAFLKKGKKKKAGKKKNVGEDWDSVQKEENALAEEASLEESEVEGETAIEEPFAGEEPVTGEESFTGEEPAMDDSFAGEEPVMEEPALAETEEEPLMQEEGEPEGESASAKKKAAGNKKGFLDTFFEAIFGEDEEPAKGEKLDENGEILKELEQEDNKAKGKKKEKKKKEKGNKKKEKAGGKKEKKPKPEKVKKKPEAPVKEPGRPVNPKFLFVLVAFCATVIAAVNLLSIFLTDYADKQNARTAFYSGQYEDVYLLLYNRTLNAEEQLIYNRADTVLQLQRRLDSYHANKKMGMEAEALDSLLLGVIKYESLAGGETYGASDELRALYQDILNTLSTEYGISEEMAMEINTYDSEAYTQKIYALINGTGFAEEPEEGAEPEAAGPQDILPDEEDIINVEMQ